MNYSYGDGVKNGTPSGRKLKLLASRPINLQKVRYVQGS